MKSSSARKSRGFEPVVITITVESQEELEQLHKFGALDVTVPDLAESRGVKREVARDLVKAIRKHTMEYL